MDSDSLTIARILNENKNLPLSKKSESYCRVFRLKSVKL